MRRLTSWLWVLLVLLTLIVGCGGSTPITSGNNTTSGAIFSLKGNWNGDMQGADGTDSTMNLVYTAGVVSGTVQIPKDTGVVYTVSGTIQSSGAMNISSTPPGLPALTIVGNMQFEGGGSTAGYLLEGGTGTMTLGTTQLAVTFNLTSIN